MARSRAAVVATVAALTAVVLASAAVGWWLAGLRPAALSGTVVEVVDGDTLVVALDGGRHETVRLLGVDTPETVHPTRGVECFGPEASAHTAARLHGARVELEVDVEPRDRYGRLLAYVLVDGRRVNDELLRDGFARLLVIPPNVAHARTLLRAELDAARAGRGLWAACGR